MNLDDHEIEMMGVGVELNYDKIWSGANYYCMVKDLYNVPEFVDAYN